MENVILTSHITGSMGKYMVFEFIKYTETIAETLNVEAIYVAKGSIKEPVDLMFVIDSIYGAKS